MKKQQSKLPTSKMSLKEKVEKALAEFRPGIEGHGGDFRVISAAQGKVKIRILGACLGCPMAQMTFGAGMEELIKEKVPEVKEVEFEQ